MICFKCSVLLINLALVYGEPPNLEWRNWKERHGKIYSDEEEELTRKHIWLENSRFIKGHNKQNHPYELEINGFADMVCAQSFSGMI